MGAISSLGILSYVLFQQFRLHQILHLKYTHLNNFLGGGATYINQLVSQDGELKKDTSGEIIFSKSRLLKVLPITLVCLLGLHIILSALYYYSTKFEENVYITGKQEIETGELYQFGGCTSLPCSTATDNGKFYLIESSLYFPMLFYPEENVFANVPQQDAVCEVHGYGLYFRSLRWLYKSAQF